MKHIAMLALAFALILPAVVHAEDAAHAEGLSYSYIEGGYARVDFDAGSGGDIQFDGHFLRGSVELGEFFYLFGGLLSAGNNDFGADLDFDQRQVGLGYRLGLSDHVDLLSEISYLDETVETPGHAPEEADGYRASVGVRGLISDRLEGFVKANYTRLQAHGHDAHASFGGTVAAEFLLNHTWRLVGEVAAGEGVTEYGVGVRASF